MILHHKFFIFLLFYIIFYIIFIFLYIFINERKKKSKLNIGIYKKMMDIENNNFLLGVIKKNKKKQSNKSNSNINNVFIQELVKIQNTIRQESNNTVIPPMSTNNQSNKLSMIMTKNEDINNKKTFKNILLGIIRKLEEDVETVSRQIKRYNEEKKSILEMDKKEILKLKSLTKKLYQTIMKIYMSLDVNKDVRIELLEKLKKNIESNKILLKNINEIDNIKPVENIIEMNKFNKNNNQNKNNKNKNKNKNQEEEIQEEVVENQEPSNVTIFNIINENKKSKNNQNKNKIVEEVINESTNVSNNLSESEPESESESVSETELETVSLNQQIKEKKINTSKKVSKKLNELNMNNSSATTLLNNFLVERIGTSQVERESNSSNNSSRSNNILRSNNSLRTNNSTRNNNYQPAPISSNRRNNNVFI